MSVTSSFRSLHPAEYNIIFIHKRIFVVYISRPSRALDISILYIMMTSFHANVRHNVLWNSVSIRLHDVI
jgi:hypothetical protein